MFLIARGVLIRIVQDAHDTAPARLTSGFATSRNMRGQLEGLARMLVPMVARAAQSRARRHLDGEANVCQHFVCHVLFRKLVAADGREKWEELWQPERLEVLRRTAARSWDDAPYR